MDDKGRNSSNARSTRSLQEKVRERHAMAVRQQEQQRELEGERQQHASEQEAEARQQAHVVSTIGASLERLAEGDLTVRCGDLATRELGNSEDVRGGAGAPPVEGSTQPVPAVGIPLGMALVADVVNRQDDRHGGVQRRRVGGGVNQIDVRAPRRARQADGGPSQVGRRVPGLGHVLDSRGQ